MTSWQLSIGHGSLLEEWSPSSEHWQLADRRFSSCQTDDQTPDQFLDRMLKSSVPTVSPPKPTFPNQYFQEGESTQLDTPPLTSRAEKDYEKNIVSYITQTAVGYFLSCTYRRVIERLCRKYRCELEAAREYYSQKKKQTFGIAHLQSLVRPQADVELEKIKKVFRKFFTWFLRQKYLIYLLHSGKMDNNNKGKYIEFKNKFLLYIDSLNPIRPTQMGSVEN